MRRKQWWALVGLLAAMVLMVGLAPAQSQKAPPRGETEEPVTPARSQKAPPKGETEETFTQRLAKVAKVSEENANRVFQNLGPIIREDLRHGKQVSIPGLGTFRVVRVEAHKDLVQGRPATIPATNTVEFLSGDELLDAANAEGAKPADSVPPFQYIPLPNQTPGQKTGNVRNPGIRTP